MMSHIFSQRWNKQLLFIASSVFCVGMLLRSWTALVGRTWSRTIPVLLLRLSRLSLSLSCREKGHAFSRTLLASSPRPPLPSTIQPPAAHLTITMDQNQIKHLNFHDNFFFPFCLSLYFFFFFFHAHSKLNWLIFATDQTCFKL